MKKIFGLIAAVFTPFDDKGDVNLSAIAPYAEKLIADKADGVFVCGTTGECPSMTIEERKAVLEEWIKVVRGRMMVIAHVGSTCQKDSINLAEHAAKAGADAIGAVPPYYFKPGSVDALVDYFQPVASAGGIPFYYYHIPSVTGVKLSMTEFLTKGSEKIPELAGIKFTDTDFMAMMECVNHQDMRFNILNGFDEMLMSGLLAGAQGGVGSTYNYCMGIYRHIMNYVAEGDMEKAREWQQKSIDVVNVIIRHGGGVRGGKAILNLIGIDCGNCRSPFTPYAPEEYDVIKQELSAIGFDNIR